MRIFIPQYLHKPNKILFLETDELVIMLLGIVSSMMLKSFLILALGLAFFYYYRKGKAKFPRGFYKHLPHIWGFKQFRHFPSIFIREFKE